MAPGGYPSNGNVNQSYQQTYPAAASGYAYPQQYDQQAYPSQESYAGYNPATSFGYDDADAQYQAELQQWQSNYGNPSAGAKNTPGQAKPSGNANALPLKNNRLEGGAQASSSTPIPVSGGDPRKTVVRKGGGVKWEDPSLLEWGNHHRIFVGNLAGEVTDDSLLKAFSKYASVQKARVIRDKRTTKSKGFGFVSFADADDFFQAAKEMNGKYIGSHPVLIKRAETEIKATNKKVDKPHNKNNKNKTATGGVSNGNKDTVLGPQPGQGVKKKTQAANTPYKLLG